MGFAAEKWYSTGTCYLKVVITWDLMVIYDVIIYNGDIWIS